MSFVSIVAPRAHRTRAFAAAATALLLMAFGLILAGCGGGGGNGGGDNGSGTSNPNQVTINGRVVDGSAGSISLPGAVVTFNGVSTTTAADGSFQLTYPNATPAGTLTITAPSGVTFYGGNMGSQLISGGCTAASTSTGGSVDLPAIGAGVTYNTGIFTFYVKTDNTPPPAPCIGPGTGT